MMAADVVPLEFVAVKPLFRVPVFPDSGKGR